MYYVIFTLTYDSIYIKKISYAILWFLLLTFNNLKFIHCMQIQDFEKKEGSVPNYSKLRKQHFKKDYTLKNICILMRGPAPYLVNLPLHHIYFVLNMHERFVKMSNPKLSVNTCLYIYMWTGVKSRLWSQSFILYFVIHCTNEITCYFVNLHLQYV